MLGVLLSEPLEYAHLVVGVRFCTFGYTIESYLPVSNRPISAEQGKGECTSNAIGRDLLIAIPIKRKWDVPWDARSIIGRARLVHGHLQFRGIHHFHRSEEPIDAIATTISTSLLILCFMCIAQTHESNAGSDVVNVLLDVFGNVVSCDKVSN